MRDALVPLLDAHFANCSGGFVWRKNDCITYVDGWLQIALRQPSLIPSWATWNDESSALSVLRQLGCADVRALANKHLKPRALFTARVGDIVARNFPQFGLTLGICAGSDVRFVSLMSGYQSSGLTRCHFAWTVG